MTLHGFRAPGQHRSFRRGKARVSQKKMLPGDAALVLRLKQRLAEGQVLDAAALVKIDYELGWLQRLA